MQHLRRWASEFEGGVAMSGKTEETVAEQLDGRPLYGPGQGHFQPPHALGPRFMPVEGVAGLAPLHQEQPQLGVAESEAFAQAFGEAVKGKTQLFFFPSS
jgi:hypothetical protein